ncbi:transcription factor HRS1-like [Wolffia australiana]
MVVAMEKMGLELSLPLPARQEKSFGEVLLAAAGVEGRKEEMVEEYMRSLENERRKIEIFRKELPLCLCIVSHAIEALEEVLARIRQGGIMPKEDEDRREKIQWMRSVRLWTNDSPSSEEEEEGFRILPAAPRRQSRKVRRRWSPELHRRFVDAIHRLGGLRVATPNQIRQLIQVDGLTNDEVKSHLQKYRLHLAKKAAAM